MIIFHFEQIETCGSVLQTFGIVERLNKLGIDACICTNYENKELEKFYSTKPVNEGKLSEINPGDVIVANWWQDIPKLEHPAIKKIQWVRTRDDIIFGKEAIENRQREGWEYIANSSYVGDWLKRPYNIIENYIHPRFFKEKECKRDINVLIEGNNEPNKNIDESIKIAKKMGGKIVWFGRNTKPVKGIEVITNPPQKDIPSLYSRAEIFIKLSKSEGFSTPILEAMSSGCTIITKDMGGNDFCKHGYNCYDWKSIDWRTLRDTDDEELIKNGYVTAQKYTLDNTINKFLKLTNETIHQQGADKSN